MTKTSYRTCIVGATGAVGQAFIKCLEKRRFPVSELVLFASKRSAGRELPFKGEMLKVYELRPAAVKGFDFAFFSAGSAISKEFAPLFAKNGAIVIDNSSAFRMDKDTPLVVPEVNAADIKKHKGIIANPNCSTIQMVVALKPLHDRARIKRIVVSTYQAVSGAGGRALAELEVEAKTILDAKSYSLAMSVGESALGGREYKIAATDDKIFPRQIGFNVIPQIPQKDAFLANGYTVEETKMIEETKKIMGDYTIKVTATCARVPVFNGHSESVNIETERKLTAAEAIEILSKAPGVKVFAKQDRAPTPAEVSGCDETFVGRIREDDTIENGLNLWIVADNILKGAALNAVQIAEWIIGK